MSEIAVQTEPHEYKVDLAVFQGPLDLLLYLIKREEVDIWDIPVARITSQYLKYIEMMTSLNLEVAGEFILMAATLIRIKTRMLLPRDENEEDEDDPRHELIMALVEYKKYKEAGEILRERALDEEQKYVLQEPVTKIEGRVDWEPATKLYDLLVAFREVMESRPKVTVHEVRQQDIHIEDRIRSIMLYLRDNEYATFRQLFADAHRKIVAVVTFIGLLELVRAHRVVIHQSKPFSEMRVYRGEMFMAGQQEVDIIDFTSIREELRA